jgi:Thiamine pyrophosphate enzyme, C-terminal TPP binding domain
MYTISALWTHAREHLNITTIILKNNSCGILREEWEHLREPGQNELHDSPLINLGGAPLDFTGLAQSTGVPAAHADTAEELAKRLTWALAEPGPRLIEAAVPRHRLRIQIRTVTATGLLRRLSRRSELQMSARREGRGIILDIQDLRGMEGVPSLWCGWSCCPRRAPGKARMAGG